MKAQDQFMETQGSGNCENCGAVRFLNRASSPTLERTILVFGCGRGGTSAMSGALRLMGVNMPNAHPLKHEWSPICFSEQQIDRETTQNNITIFDRQYPIWGWKAPKDVFYFDQYVSMLRNPHIVIVFRNIYDVINSSHKHEKLDFGATAIDISDVYRELCHLITFTCLPIALVHYDKMLQDPMGVLAKIDSWLNLRCSNDMLSAASKFTQVENGMYRPISENTHDWSFDSREIAFDQAKFQIDAYKKRAMQFSNYHAAIVEDLRKAYEVKNELDTQLTELEHPDPTGRHAALESERVAEVEGEEHVKCNDKGSLPTDAELDELRGLARIAEFSYYENKAQYLAALRHRIAIQTTIDSLAKEVKFRKLKKQILATDRSKFKLDIAPSRDIGRTSIVVFRTMPDHKNSNSFIERAFSSALRRVAPQSLIHRSSIETTLDAVLELKPQLVLGIGSIALDHIDYAAIARAARSLGARLVYWLLDDPYEFDFNWKIEGRCDWIFTSDRASVDFYQSAAVTHLPLAADRDRHFQKFVPLRHRTTDVFFCGVGYPNRRSIVSKLRDVLSSCQTVICGDGWDEGLSFCRNDRLSSEALIEAYTSARIVLNIGRHFNIANRDFELIASTPGPRTFEAGAAGCLQAAFMDTCELLDYFNHQTEIVTFSTVSEFSTIMDRIRHDPDGMDKIALAAQNRVRAAHTFDHRAQTMLDILEKEGLFNLPPVLKDQDRVA
jgi:spore maturation protein CgeB